MPKLEKSKVPSAPVAPAKKVTTKALKHLALFVAEGFEETELITAIDVFKRAGLTFDLVGVDVKGEASSYANKGHVFVKTDFEIKDFNAANYHGCYIPGGEAHAILMKNAKVLEAVKIYHREGKFVGAICAGPEVLKAAGVLDKATYTSYPGYAKGAGNTGKEVEMSGKIYTGRDFRATLPLADLIVKYFKTNHLV